MPEARPSPTEATKPAVELGHVYAALAGRADAVASVRQVAHQLGVAHYELERIRDTQLSVGIPAARAFADLDEYVREALDELRVLKADLPDQQDDFALRLGQIERKLGSRLIRANATASQRKAGSGITIILPLPRRILSPNGRAHFHPKAKAVKAYRTLAMAAARNATPGPSPRWERARALTRFFFSDRLRRDGDNLLASLKPAFDGIVDAGVLADDRGLSHEPVGVYVDRANPRVEITLTEGP